MESPPPSTQNSPQPPQPQSATGSDVTSSPSLSFVSKRHSARSGSSNSSVPSSPVTRDSLEIYGSNKRPLADVTEEPPERDENVDPLDASTAFYFQGFEQPQPRMSVEHARLNLAQHQDYDFGEREMLSERLSTLQASKKSRSRDSILPTVANRISTRFPSFSKKWINRSSTSPKLSIITHSDPVTTRASSGTSSQLISPALSAISKYESYLPPSPARTTFEEGTSDALPAPIDIGKANEHIEDEEDQGQATTPLLPPMLMEVKNTSVQSPLQSPTIADSSFFPPTPTSAATSLLQALPSPPLSSRGSLTSLGHPRSRAATIVPSSEIPPMTTLDDPGDEWSQRLGHANFVIYPEPYLPRTIDLDSYRHLRANWDTARTNYTKHLARTGENYGTTSKIYIFTEEKWASIDELWKRHDAAMANELGPILARLSDGDTKMTDSATSSAVLEKPPTKVMVPQIDETCGKFPELGDEDIVGPMAVAPRAKNTPTATETAQHNRMSKKRHFFKLISEVWGRSHAPKA